MRWISICFASMLLADTANGADLTANTLVTSRGSGYVDVRVERNLEDVKLALSSVEGDQLSALVIGGLGDPRNGDAPEQYVLFGAKNGSAREDVRLPVGDYRVYLIGEGLDLSAQLESAQLSGEQTVPITHRIAIRNEDVTSSTSVRFDRRFASGAVGVTRVQAAVPNDGPGILTVCRAAEVPCPPGGADGPAGSPISRPFKGRIDVEEAFNLGTESGYKFGADLAADDGTVVQSTEWVDLAVAGVPIARSITKLCSRAEEALPLDSRARRNAVRISSRSTRAQITSAVRNARSVLEACGRRIAQRTVAVRRTDGQIVWVSRFASGYRAWRRFTDRTPERPRSRRTSRT